MDYYKIFVCVENLFPEYKLLGVKANGLQIRNFRIFIIYEADFTYYLLDEAILT